MRLVASLQLAEICASAPDVGRIKPNVFYPDKGNKVRAFFFASQLTG